MSEVIESVIRQDEGFVVRLMGEIDMNHSPRFHEQLVGLCSENPLRLVLDLSQVQYIDSSGVGSMVDILRRLKKKQCNMILVNPSARVRGLLEITRLDEFFTIASTAEEALTL